MSKHTIFELFTYLTARQLELLIDLRTSGKPYLIAYTHDGKYELRHLQQNGFLVFVGETPLGGVVWAPTLRCIKLMNAVQEDLDTYKP